MNRNLDAAANLFDAEEMDYHRLDVENIIHTGISSDVTDYQVIIVGKEDRLVIVVKQATNIPEDRRSAVAELACRINWMVKYGQFELDFDDGELRYRLEIPTDEQGVSVPVMRHAFFAPLSYMHSFFPAIMAVTFGGMTAKQALALHDAGKVDIANDASPSTEDARGDSQQQFLSASTQIH